MSVVEEEISLPVVTFKRQRVGNKIYLRRHLFSSQRLWIRFRMDLQLKKTQNSKLWLHMMLF